VAPPTGTVAALLTLAGHASTGVHRAASPETSRRSHVRYPRLVDLGHAWAMHTDDINRALPMRTELDAGEPLEQGFAQQVAAWLDDPTPVGREVLEGVVLPKTQSLDMAAIAEEFDGDGLDGACPKCRAAPEEQCDLSWHDDTDQPTNADFGPFPDRDASEYGDMEAGE
jgi:hypothetical protein